MHALIRIRWTPLDIWWLFRKAYCVAAQADIGGKKMASSMSDSVLLVGRGQDGEMFVYVLLEILHPTCLAWSDKM